MRLSRSLTNGIMAGIAGVLLAGMAAAQVPRSSVDMQVTPGLPEFRDPRTGQVWTPDNVGQGPLKNPTPADLAFDPLGQAVRHEGVIVQRPKLVPLDAAATLAAPGTPIVTLDGASLRAVPGRRWQVVLYVNNLSPRTVAPMIDCRFTNAGRLVEDTRVLVPAMGMGVRGGLTIWGPKTDLFVDRATCRITSP